MSKSKSKTFPKGTDSFDIGDWIEGQITLRPSNTRSGDETVFKYLITITKIEEKKKP